MSLVKRFFVFALMVSTVFSMSAFTLNVKAAGSYPAGSLLALEGVQGAAVYYIGSDGMKYVFPDPKTYATWYPNFDSVVRVSVSELDMYPDGGAVSYRPGTRLITHENTAKVYAVTPGGYYCHIPSEAVAVALYGANWGAMVQDVIPGYFSSSYMDGNCELSDTLPDGTLVMMGETYYYIENGMKRPFASADAFEANNFSYDFVMTVSDLSGYADGSSITGEEEALSGFMPGEGGTVTPPVVSGNLSVALSSNSPAAGNVVTGVDNIPFAKYTFTAGSGDVTVTSVKIGRTGLGSTGDFSSVTLYEGSTKLGSTRTTWSSDNTINFNIPGGWDIASGTSRELTVVAKLGTSNTYNALGIVDVVLASGSFGGSLPLYGNQMTGVAVTVGGVTITNVGSNATKNIGTTDVTLAEFKLAVNGTEDGHFKSITLKNKGTASDSDVANVYLYQGANMVAGPVSMNSDKIVFVLEEPFAIDKSKNETFKVVGDVTNGDTHTVNFVLDATTDLVVEGQTYMTALSVTSTAYNDAGEGATITIDGAELNIAFSSAPVDTMDDKDDVVFGELTLGSGATDLKITTLIFTIDETDGNSDATDNMDVDEFELVASDGTAYSGAMTGGGDTDADNETWTFDEEIYLLAGQSETFTLRGDLPAGIGDGDSYKVTMTVNTTNVVAETEPEGDTVDSFSITSINGKLVTVQQPYITVKATAQNAENAVTNAAGVSVFKGTVKATAGDVKVTRMRFEGGNTAAGNTTEVTTNLDGDNWNGMTLWINGNAIQAVSGSNISSGVVDFDSFEYTFPAGVLTTFEIKGDVAATLTANTTVHVQLDTVTAKDEDNDDATVQDSAAVAIADNAELETTRTLTLTDKGVLYLSLRNADTGYNKDRVALAGNDYWVAKLRVRAEYEDVTIEDLKLLNTVANAEDSIDQVCVYNAESAIADNLVGCASMDASDIVFLEDINYVVEVGTEDWYVYVKTREMGNGGLQTADTKDQVALVVTSTSGYVVARGYSSNELLTMGDKDGSVEAGEVVFDTNLDGTFDAAGENQTATGKNFIVSGSKVASVSFVSSFGGEVVASNLTGTGTYTLAILKIATESHNNTNSNGDALIWGLNNLVLDVTKYGSTTFSGATIERIGGTQGAQALTITAVDGNGETSGDWLLNNATTSLTTDGLIENGDTGHFVIKGTVNGVNATEGVIDWVQINLDSLDSGTNNIDWFDGYAGYGSTANDFDYLRLDTTSLTGTKISDQ